jgi:hypothetical protein
MAYKERKQNSPRLLDSLGQRAAPLNKFRVVGVNNVARQVWDYGVYSSYTDAKQLVDNPPDPACNFYVHNSYNRVMYSSR